MPGYRAPQQTTDAAIGISGTFARVAAAGRGETAAPSGVLDRQLADVADAVTPGADHAQLALAVLAWTQLFGAVSFEVFGQFANTLEPADELFEYLLDATADRLGL